MNFSSKDMGNKILAAIVGVFLIGVGVAFNNCAGLGNDPVGIVYDGMRNAAGLSVEQLGMASNAVNIFLVLLLCVIGRRYISIGTIIYFLPYGFFVSIGERIYRMLLHTETMAVRIGFSVLGCLLLYLGVAIFIVVDIGVDPFTGIVLVICDKVKREYRFVKVAFDISMIILGTALGGTLGVVTVATALTGGPVIQFFKSRIQWLFQVEKTERG
ncbi:MAG: hypothetical protein PUJ55_15560 [Clostridiales bacterium]|nr:hypothetical protein [Roseburia sp.]MDD7638339.1 hypothetical protein [Clostridiales bacterium]MDY4111334.1 hypothetical protein [Roseburia sp.]